MKKKNKTNQRWSNLNKKVPKRLSEELNEANDIKQLGTRFKMLEAMVEGPGSEMHLKSLDDGTFLSFYQFFY